LTFEQAKGHAVAFFAINGDIVRSRETREALLAAIAAVLAPKRLALAHLRTL
jgi:hypothetical protein